MSDYRVRSENALASISRYEEQQKEVRNNREFDNLNKEIETSNWTSSSARRR